MDMSPKEFYTSGESDRQSFIDRAIKFSEITIPYVIRDDGTGSGDELIDKYGQSFCGRAVSSLKAKLGMSLMPPASSAFKFEPTQDELDKVTQELNDQANAQGQEEQGLDETRAILFARISRGVSSINKEIDAQSIRAPLFDIIEQLLIAGSVVMEKVKDDGILLHGLQSFVVKLDKRGRPLGICIKEVLSELPEGMTPEEVKDEYELYTLVEKVVGEKKWSMSQEVDGNIIEEVASFTDETLPYHYVGWKFALGDSYHRPFVEDYYADMEQFSALSNLLTDGSIGAAKTLIMVDQRNGRTRLKDIATSRNMDIINGRADDVTAMQLGKNYDFSTGENTKAELKRDIAAAFLMNESATRDAERVTAAEINLLAQELESTSLAGAYSSLSENVVRRLITWVMNEMGLTFSDLGVKIIVGLDALGRSKEVQNLDELINRLFTVGANHLIKVDELAHRYANSYGVDESGLFKTPTEVKKEQEAAQQAQRQQVLAESGAQAAGQEAGAEAGRQLAQQVQ